jgi:hypothetical protein
LVSLSVFVKRQVHQAPSLNAFKAEFGVCKTVLYSSQLKSVFPQQSWLADSRAD